MKRVTYLLTEALTNIRLNQTTTIVAVATTAFTMACFGVFLLLYLNLRGVTSTLQDDIKVVVYVTDAVSAQALGRSSSPHQERSRSGRVTYVSKEQALADFREQFPSEGYLLQGLGRKPSSGVIAGDDGASVSIVRGGEALGRTAESNAGRRADAVQSGLDRKCGRDHSGILNGSPLRSAVFWRRLPSLLSAARHD